MPKNKRKLTKAEKAEKQRRRELYMTIFFNGKMKRVRRPPMVNGVPLEEFLRSADPIWLHQNELWEYIPFEPACVNQQSRAGVDTSMATDSDDSIPGDDEIPF